MDRERLDSWLEKGILGLVTLILIASPALFGSTRLIDFLVTQALTTVALGLWVIRFWVRSEYRILWPPIAWGVTAFLLYAMWRYHAADIEYVARLDFNRIVVYASLFFLILDNLNRQESSQFLIYVAIFSGMAMAMYAVYQFATGSRTIFNTPQPLAYYGRAGGPFVCPNHLAGYLGLVLPLAFALTLMARLNTVMKVFLCYAGIVMLAGLFVTLSRGGWAATALGLLTLFTALLFNRDFRLPAILALLLILVPAGWVGAKSFQAQQRLNKGVASTGQFRDDRFHVWPSAVTLWRENFWTGVGPNHFDVRFRALRPPLGQMQARPDRVHNDYLNVLADWGMIGFALLTVAVGLFWLSVVRIWRFVRRSNDFGSRQSTRAAIVLGACAGFVALMAHIFVDFDMHIPGVAILAVTLLAIVTGHWRFATERFWVRPGVIGRTVATAICLTAVCWLGFQTSRLGREQWTIIRAEHFPETHPSHVALLKEAQAIEPKNPLTAFRIGEALRKIAWGGMGDYQKTAAEAIAWCDTAISLDPYDPHPYLTKGMCLDWLGRKDEAWPYFRKTLLLDPNSYYVRAHFGWHLMQFQAWRQAGKWFIYSLNLRPKDNPIAETYYEIAKRKYAEQSEGIHPGLTENR